LLRSASQFAPDQSMAAIASFAVKALDVLVVTVIFTVMT
jgi:hypothetical protein